MSAQIAQTLLKQVQAIHTDMNTVTFFQQDKTSLEILQQLNVQLSDFENKLRNSVISDDYFVQVFQSILRLLVTLYEKSYANLEKSYDSGAKMETLASLIDELKDITEHFGLMKVASVYSHINTIDSLFQRISQK